jgi:hypothetical protein
VKKNLIINYDEIQRAMEDVRRDRSDYYLDLETGDVKTISVDKLDKCLEVLYENIPHDYEKGVEFDSEVRLDAELPESFEETIEFAITLITDKNRYIRIPERDSSEAFNTMRDFAHTVNNEKLRKRLESSLDGPGSFRNFKNTLLSDRKERKRWHGYNAKRMRTVIERWLRRIDI